MPSLENEQPDVTAILRRLSAGDAGARDELFPIVYGHLRRIAGAQFSNERQGHILQPTALINEAYLCLVRVDERTDWVDRGHFFSMASKIMRQILISHARAKLAKKRSGAAVSIDLERAAGAWNQPEPILISIHEALERLEKTSPRAYQLVELKFFGGLDFEQASQVLNVSSRTLKRDWRAAKKWLERELGTNAQGAEA